MSVVPTLIVKVEPGMIYFRKWVRMKMKGQQMMDQEIIILSEVKSEQKKDKYHKISFICGI